jgi:hypothetical protein
MESNGTALAAKEYPFEKAVELFALVGGPLDCRPQLLIGGSAANGGA